MPRPPRMLLLTLVAVLAALPVIVTAFSPWAGATSVLVLSLLPVLGVARGGIRSMVLASAAAAVTVLVSLLLVQTGPLLPWLGTALVIGLAVLASPLVKIGRESTGALVIVLAVYLMAVPDSASAPFASMGPLGVAVALGALVAFTTAWASAVIWLALRRVRIPASEVPPPTLPYTLLLAFLAGLFTFVTLMWFRETNAWWSVLTVAVVLQPTGAKLASRVLARVAGTVLGGVIAYAVAVWVPAEAVTLVGGVAALVTAVLKLTARPYWAYAAALTVTIVLTSFAPHEVLVGDAMRVGITVATALLTAAAAVVVARFLPARPASSDR